jgi:hypothetical protein
MTDSRIEENGNILDTTVKESPEYNKIDFVRSITDRTDLVRQIIKYPENGKYCVYGFNIGNTTFAEDLSDVKKAFKTLGYIFTVENTDNHKKGYFSRGKRYSSSTTKSRLFTYTKKVD